VITGQPANGCVDSLDAADKSLVRLPGTIVGNVARAYDQINV
jgi:hypothetical protein